VLHGVRTEEADDRLAGFAVPLLVGERGQPQQSDGRQSVGARRGVVHEVLRPCDQGLRVVTGGEHAAPLRIPEQVEQCVGRRSSLSDPAG